jgi:hypothetical protein
MVHIRNLGCATIPASVGAYELCAKVRDCVAFDTQAAPSAHRKILGYNASLRRRPRALRHGVAQGICVPPERRMYLTPTIRNLEKGGQVVERRSEDSA